MSNILEPTALEQADPQAVQAAFEAAVAEINKDGIIPQEVLDRLNGGETLGQAMGLNRSDMEHLYALGFGYLNSGKLQLAEDVFRRLVLLDPLEAKNHYCLGFTLQQKGEVVQAGRAYVNFLALDATNPDGYLRLGECLLADGAPDQAREAFDEALTHSEGKADKAAQAEAARAALAVM